MTELIDELEDIEVAIFDLDGVIYRGDQLLPNVDNVIKKLTTIGIKVAYNSNNSTETRDMYVKKLSNHGIECSKDDIYTSASITANELTKIKGNATIFVIGEFGLKEELKKKGHSIAKINNNCEEVDFVVVGLDRNFNYQKISFAQQCILQGKAQFYATNQDATLPVSNGVLPGAGVMVKALEVCTGNPPIQTYGKPQKYGIESILNDLQVSPSNVCIFGDRLDTDILAGNRAGIKTIAVLTGVTTTSQIEKVKQNEATRSKNKQSELMPDVVLNNLEEMFKS